MRATDALLGRLFALKRNHLQALLTAINSTADNSGAAKRSHSVAFEANRGEDLVRMLTQSGRR
jgi:hypothetical protein